MGTTTFVQSGRVLRATLLMLVTPLALLAQQSRTAEIEVIADSSGQPVSVNGRQMGVTPSTLRIQPGTGVRIEVGRGARMRSLSLDVAAGSRIKVEMTMPRDTQPLPGVRSAAEIQRQLLASNDYPMPRQPVAPTQPRRPGFFGSVLIGGGLAGGAAFAASAALCDQKFTSPSPSGGYVGDTYYPPGPQTLGVSTPCQGSAAAIGALVGTGFIHLIRRGGYKGRVANFTRVQAQYQTDRVAYDRAVQQREQLLEDDLRELLDEDQERRRAVASANDRAIRANRELPLVTFLNTARGQVVGGRTSSEPPALLIESVQFVDADGDSVISAGERASVRVRLRNGGRGPGVNVRVEAKSNSRLRFVPGQIGAIAPGELREAVIDVVATQDVVDEQALLEIIAIDDNGFDSQPLELYLPVFAYRPPDLAILGAQAVDGEGRTIISPGTQAKVTVRVQNRGQGKADGVVVTISRGENVLFTDDLGGSTATRALGTLRAGEYRDIEVEVLPNNRATAFELNASVSEATGRYNVPPRDLGLQLNRASSGIAQVVTVAPPRPAAGATTAGSFGSDLLLNIPRVAENPNTIAVIIGNSTYAGDIPPVQFAANDAAVMRQYAQRALGIRPGNIITLTNATGTQLRTTFGIQGDPTGRLRSLVRPGVSEVFVFYSGHGAPDASEKKAYIMPVDADVSFLASTGYSVDLLYENLAAMGAKHVTVVLDACFSGASGSGKMLIQNASPIGIQVNDPAQRFQGGNATIIAAAEGQQLANWYNEKNHGILTYFFLKGLQGEADTDKNGEVTVDEMKAFLTDPAYGIPYEARRLHGRDQTPQVFGGGSRTLRPKLAGGSERP